MSPIPHPSAKQGRRLAVGAGVVLAHACVFAVVALTQATPPRLATGPVIDVELFSAVVPPPPPPPPPPPKPPAPVSGGGAPAAPSVIHTPPNPRPVEREVPAPPVKAPEQALVVGAAPIASPTPGFGQGGQGTGTGSGLGEGDGPGSGGTPPIILRRASQAELLSVVPREAREARRPGRASVNCVIRIDQRLDDCRVVSAAPPGFRFEEAALRAADFFRYRPPLDAAGRPVQGQRVTIFIAFGRQ